MTYEEWEQTVSKKTRSPTPSIIQPEHYAVLHYALRALKQKPRCKLERGFVASGVILAKALLVIVRHLASQAVLDGKHLAYGNDLAALFTHVLGRLAHSPGMLSGLLTGLSHLSYSFAVLALIRFAGIISPI